MAIVDQFLYGFVQGGLEPGEAVMGVGMLRRPTVFNAFGVPQKYDDYLAVATDRRLIVFDTETGFSLLTPTAKPVARNPMVWRYDELAAVRTGAVEGAVIHSGGAGTWIALVPHPYCGPLSADQDPDDLTHGKARRYDIYAHIDGIDGQRALHAQFPRWLAERVQAGAFPLPPHKRAEVESRIAARRAAQAAELERRRRAAEARDAQIRAAWAAFRPYAVAAGLGLGGVVGIGLGALMIPKAIDLLSSAQDGVAHYEARVAFLKRDQVWAADPKLAPPADCPEEKLPFFYGHDTRGARRCHLCIERDKGKSEPATGGRSFPRGEKVWDCPAPTVYAADLKEARERLARYEEDETEFIIRLVEGGAALFLGLVAAIVAAVLAKKKHRALRSAASSSGGPPGPGATLGAPLGPG